MKENIESNETSKESKQEIPIEKEKEKIEELPKEDFQKTEMCQLIFYDFTVK